MVEGFFDEIPDSRQDWKVVHSIDEILTVVMCGVSAGKNTVHGIYAFAEIKEGWLKEKVGLRLPNGLPSYDMIKRVLGMIDPKVFQGLFIKWIEEKLSLKEGSYISLDGKADLLFGHGHRLVLGLEGLEEHEGVREMRESCDAQRKGKRRIKVLYLLDR